jgi:hypothetical protein
MRTVIFASLIAMNFLNVAVADNLLIERVNKETGTSLPRRGATMSTVEAQLGAPTKKHAAVGRPPITRWDYPGFSVYFEYSHVIDSVAVRATSTEMGVKPVNQPKQ